MDNSHSVLHVYIFNTRSGFSLNGTIIFSVPQAFARSSTMASSGVRENVHLNMASSGERKNVTGCHQP